MVGVLHTWGRALAYHPHVHYLMPAGAWDGQIWRHSKHKRFLLPVKTLSYLFRDKVRDALQATTHFAQVPAAVWRKPWVVHCQPVGSGQRALSYLAPYIFRVAITNRRLVSLADDPTGGPPTVTFRHRPSGTRQWQLCTVTVMEFIRRFLQHVLPKGFVKVRYSCTEPAEVTAFSVQGSDHAYDRLWPGCGHHPLLHLATTNGKPQGLSQNQRGFVPTVGSPCGRCKRCHRSAYGRLHHHVGNRLNDGIWLTIDGKQHPQTRDACLTLPAAVSRPILLSLLTNDCGTWRPGD